MSINASINTMICSYMNTASAHGREKSAHTRRMSETASEAKQRRSDRQSGEKKN